MAQYFDFLQSNILVLALGMLLIKCIIFIIYLRNKEKDEEIIEKNIARLKKANQQQTQLQQTQQPPLMSSIEAVNNWQTEDFRLSQDLRQQFLTKTRTRRTPSSDRASPREKVPLATTDMEDNTDVFGEDGIPIYQYNPSIGGTQV